MLVLSLFPGGGLFDRAFELEGFCVVRGPDLLFGGDVRRFHPPAGVFDLVIGGPPCQKHSRGRHLVGSDAVDLIPEFVRVAEEARPRFGVVMENVVDAIRSEEIPRDWHPVDLRDWDCGGLTNRRRFFWTWPFALMASRYFAVHVLGNGVPVAMGRYIAREVRNIITCVRLEREIRDVIECETGRR